MVSPIIGLVIAAAIVIGGSSLIRSNKDPINDLIDRARDRLSFSTDVNENATNDIAQADDAKPGENEQNKTQTNPKTVVTNPSTSVRPVQTTVNRIVIENPTNTVQRSGQKDKKRLVSNKIGVLNVGITNEELQKAQLRTGIFDNTSIPGARKTTGINFSRKTNSPNTINRLKEIEARKAEDIFAALFPGVRSNF